MPAGVPCRVPMQLTGHETRSVFDRYNTVSGRDLAEVAKKLDAARGQWDLGPYGAPALRLGRLLRR